MKISGVEIIWLGHSSFLIKNSKKIYIDPYNLGENPEKADIVFITHSHPDHCSFTDLKKILNEGTIVVCPPDCQSSINKFESPIKIILSEPGKEFSIGDIKVSAINAYNTNKQFHSKNEMWVGYLIKFHDIFVYHAGDTDLIPEMQKLTGYKQAGKEFIALLPVSGKYVMNAEEAAEAAKLIKPTLAIPMHWGSIIGSDKDAKEFVELCEENGIKAVMLGKE